MMKKILIGGAIVVVAFIVIAVMVGGKTSDTAPTASPPNQVIPTGTATTEARSPVPTFPPQVEQARAAAQSYLGLKGFSYDGLVTQLSSDYGDKFPKDVATQAVDSLSIDWNAQAAKAAESYLAFQPFSCAALITQLSAEYGDRFTVAQATYGAHQTNACK